MDIVDSTIREWRELGFHYERDDAAKLWTISGTLDGLANFATILRDFANNPRNDELYEHDHHGPYGYLKIMNVPGKRGFDGNAIFAPLRDFAILADEIENKLSTAPITVFLPE